MTPALPIRSLLRLNLVVTLVVSGIIFLYLFADHNEPHILLYTGMTAVAIASISYSNVLILIYLNRKFGIGTKLYARYRMTLSYLLSFGVYSALSPVFAHYSGRPITYLHQQFWIILLISSVLVNTLVLILHRVVLLMYWKSQTELELSQLRTAHAEAANLLLKQQIHPHFLFNALNMLKTLYRKDVKEGDAYIVHLANFLRASISSHDTKLSAVNQEVALLKDYLEMQRMRFGCALKCTIDIPADIAKNFSLPSFSLQPLLENAIKHNELTEQAPLNVYVYYRESRIYVENNLQKKFVMLASTNYGLANLAERYRLLSGDEIIITQNETTFTVSIKLLNHADSNHRG
jgi:two-component system, LytTR family, sensor kinase